MSKATIVTNSGDTFTGEVIRRSGGDSNVVADILGGIATGGLREVFKPEPTVTIKDIGGGFHSGTVKH